MLVPALLEPQDLALRTLDRAVIKLRHLDVVSKGCSQFRVVEVTSASSEAICLQRKIKGENLTLGQAIGGMADALGRISVAVRSGGRFI